MQKTQETQIQSLGWEDPLEEEMAIHSSILAWKSPWTEEPGGLQSMGSQRVRCNCRQAQAVWLMTWMLSSSAKDHRNHSLLKGWLGHRRGQRILLNRWQMTVQTHSGIPAVHSHPTSNAGWSHFLGPGCCTRSFFQPRRWALMRLSCKYQLCLFKLSWPF